MFKGSIFQLNIVYNFYLKFYRVFRVIDVFRIACTTAHCTVHNSKLCQQALLLHNEKKTRKRRFELFCKPRLNVYDTHNEPLSVHFKCSIT